MSYIAPRPVVAEPGDAAFATATNPDPYWVDAAKSADSPNVRRLCLLLAYVSPECQDAAVSYVEGLIEERAAELQSGRA